MMQLRSILLLVSILVVGIDLARAQSVLAAGTPKSATQEAVKKKDRVQQTLIDAGRVSTEEAARSATEERTEHAGAKSEDEKKSDSGVVEFRPVNPNARGGTEGGSTSDAQKKSKGRILKNVHGTAYGAAGSSGVGNRTGAAVGASSPGGRTSIYVETERDRGNFPPR